jgi:hypothetical protein
MDPEIKESDEAFEALFDTSVEKLTQTIIRSMSWRSKSFKAIAKATPKKVQYWILCGLRVAVDRKLTSMVTEVMDNG